MSMDIQFIAFSETKADAFWKSAALHNLLNAFISYEQTEENAEALSGNLLRLDLNAGGTHTMLEQGNSFVYHLEQLPDAFLSEIVTEKDWSGMPINYEIAPPEYYQTLFDHLSIEKIRAHFPDEELAESLIILYQDLKPVIDALQNSDRKLYINVNDALYATEYFIERTTKHSLIFLTLYEKWKAMKHVDSREPEDEISENQAQLL